MCGTSREWSQCHISKGYFIYGGGGHVGLISSRMKDFTSLALFSVCRVDHKTQQTLKQKWMFFIGMEKSQKKCQHAVNKVYPEEAWLIVSWKLVCLRKQLPTTHNYFHTLIWNGSANISLKQQLQRGEELMKYYTQQRIQTRSHEMSKTFSKHVECVTINSRAACTQHHNYPPGLLIAPLLLTDRTESQMI